MSTNLPDSPEQESLPVVEAESADQKKPEPGRAKGKWQKILLIVAVCSIVGFAISYLIQNNKQKEEETNRIEISGRIEATETHLAAAVASRVKTVLVKEGDSVHKGQLVLSLDAKDVKTKLNEVSSAMAQAQAAQAQARAQVQTVQNEVSQAQAKSKGFFAKVFTTKGKKEKIKTQLRTEMTQAQIMLHQTQAEVAKAQSIKSQLDSHLSYFNMESPIEGICSLRSVQPGELVAPGQVMITIIDPKAVYMKGYIPEGSIAKVKIGQTAEVFLDSQSQPLKAKLVAIDPRPSFTPENIYFKQDRVRQVFGVKLSLENPDGTAKPGMPADAKITFSPETTQ